MWEKGWGREKGERKGPVGVTSTLQSPDVGLVLAAAAAASVKFAWCCGQLDPAPFPGGSIPGSGGEGSPQ